MLAWSRARCKHEEAEQLQARILGELARNQVPSRDEWEDLHTAWLAARGLWREYLEVRSRDKNSLPRISCYHSYLEAIRGCGDPPSASVASGVVLTGFEGQALPTATSCGLLSAAESARVRAALLAEVEKALRPSKTLKGGPDRNLAPFIAFERVSLLYTLHQLRQAP